MHVIHHAHLPHRQHGGEELLCAADASRGIRGFEVWLRTLQPGAHTGWLRHGGELVVLALVGAGKLQVDGGPQRFQGPCSLVVPADAPFELSNHGSAPLQLVWVFSAAPEPVADGAAPGAAG